jgi:hypothetical protein
MKKVLKRMFGLKEEDMKINWRTLDNFPQNYWVFGLCPSSGFYIIRRKETRHF